MFDVWYQNHYHEMSNSGRWFRGAGINLIPASSWNMLSYRILIVRLSTARDTGDSFTHQLLYQIAAGCNGIFVDCAWLPPPEDCDLFNRDSIPWLTGVVSKRPAADFDCIAISNSIVQELVNIPLLLTKSNIPAGKQERMKDINIPLILLGGANALFSSALLSDNPVVDAIFVGEDVSLIRTLFTICRDGKFASSDKINILESLCKINGIILPDKPTETKKTQFPIGKDQLLLNAPVFSGINEENAGSLQISEGCPCFCTFCAESWSRKPYREVTESDCVSAALSMKKAMGIDKINLYSFNFNMHEHFKDLLIDLSGMFSSIGLKSQRLDGIAQDPYLMSLLHSVGKTSITVGIEGISSRLRIWLQKSIDDTQLHTGLQRILSTSIRELKLFFIATGKETTGDFDEFRELLVFITETMRSVKRQPRIIVSMTPLVHFPFTPLENESAVDADMMREIILQCERLTMAKRLEFRSASSMNEYLFSQLIVRANDKRIWNCVCDALSTTGFIYYNEISDRFIETFKEKLAGRGLLVSELLRGGQRSGLLPVQLEVDRIFIESTVKSSHVFNSVGYCVGSEQKRGKCLGCGACNSADQQMSITQARRRQNIRAEYLKKIVLESNRCVTLVLSCTIDKSFRGVSRTVLAAEMAHLFMTYNSVCAQLYRGFQGSFIVKKCENEWIHGDDHMMLRFQENATEMLTSIINDDHFIGYLNQALSGKCQINKIAFFTQTEPVFSLSISSEWKCDPAVYLANNALKYMLLKGPDKCIEYKFSKDSLKKKILSQLRICNLQMKSIIDISPGIKFNFNEFIKTVIQLPSEIHSVRIETTANIH